MSIGVPAFPVADARAAGPSIEHSRDTGGLAALMVVVGLYLVGHAAFRISGQTGAGWAAGSIADYALTLLPVVGVMAWWSFSAAEPITDAFGLRRPADPSGVTARVVLLSTLAIVAVGLAVSVWIARPLAVDSGKSIVSLPGIWSTAVLVAVLTPVCEEMVFRGYLYRRIHAVTTGSALPVVATSLAFAALHLPRSPLHAATLIGIAFVLGILRARSGSIWPGVVLHAVWNGSFFALMVFAVHVG